jgi:hypothetical protein
MRSILPATVVISAAIASIVYSQRTTREVVAKSCPTKLFIGQPLADAKNALSAQQIEFGEGGFAFAKGDPDQENLIVIIDKNHTHACVYYSKSRSRISGLHLVFFPSRKHGKLVESWLPATELQLNSDRTYSVTFSPSFIEDELRQLEESRTEPQLPPNSK